MNLDSKVLQTFQHSSEEVEIQEGTLHNLIIKV
jgi:hypothetical protein